MSEKGSSIVALKKGFRWTAGWFADASVDPLDQVTWEKRTAQISDETGKVYFEQKDVSVPVGWSQIAVNVVVSKYFRGHVGTASRETSVRQLISRVADTIMNWGWEQGYFADEATARIFNKDLKFLLVHQMMAFNSPVWFNVGVEPKPQCSACFINSVDDSMESIMGLAKTEALLFKWGSGTGTNLSNLRGSMEKLRGGGTASGPVSFMRGFDAFAGVIKSGGKTRRAAKMVILDIDHPDIEEFIWCKAKEEKKAHALIDAGYDGSFTGEAYATVSFQNANNSVRVSDSFMRAVEDQAEVSLISRTKGEVVHKVPAMKLWRDIAEAAHQCGDPGLQFHTTINDWHTSSNTAQINASNPCSEYMFLDDSACNLASLNLRKFQNEHGKFQAESFLRAVHLTILAQEILVSKASYPTEKIEENSHRFRPLGLGYANLGALLMSMGHPYDSVEGRAVAAFITSMMCGQAYLTSATIAEVMGACDGFAQNREPFLQVIRKHRAAHEEIGWKNDEWFELGRKIWDDAHKLGTRVGFRNSQVTVLAPTGTIGFMMDCDTTGIEPDIALVKYKRLVGGGTLKIVNQTVRPALERLGYPEFAIVGILKYIEEHETIEGEPQLDPKHLAVFDCAFKPNNGIRSIHYMGHIKMMAAVQPFLSGAISKTVNLPNDATVEDIEDAYMKAWKLGLKAIAVYRDGCKRSQPLSTAKVEDTSGKQIVKLTPAGQLWSKLFSGQQLTVEEAAGIRGQKKKLPDTRPSLTHKFTIGGQKGYFTVGLYPDGTPGELFIEMQKQGSATNGLLDSFAKAVTKGLKYGVPIEEFCTSFIDTRFDPSGITSNEEIRIASSVMDYIFRWLRMTFSFETSRSESTVTVTRIETRFDGHDGTLCHECGSQMVRSGSCHKCLNCGSTSGCS